MLFQVPDSLSGSTGTNSVSHRNRYYNNKLGVSPEGERLPNGVDFWWDDAPAQEDNCWYANGTVRTEPALLPSSCENLSTGATYATKITELLGCAGAIDGGGYDPKSCVWFQPPPKPAAASAAAGLAALPSRSASGAPADQLADALSGACELAGTSLSCSAFRGRP
jgi:hypothetical protein